MKYAYSVIRFVPEPVRGEFVNIGVLAGSEDASEWDVRCVANLKRARSLDDKGLLRLVWNLLDDLGRRVDRYTDAIQGSLFQDGDQRLDEKWLARLVQESRNIVQFSTPGIVIAGSLAEALDMLFQQFIVEPESRKFSFKKKNVALAAVRKAYRDAGLFRSQHFEEGASVRGQHHAENFDFVVANGQALQLAQTWSFQVPNQMDLAEQVKAWAWTVNDLREHGGVARTGAREVDVPRDVDIEVVYVPPSGNMTRETLDEALAAFDRLGVVPVECDRARDLGSAAARLVKSAIH